MTVGKSTGKSRAGEERRRETLSNDGFELTDTAKPADQRGACERKGFKSVVQKSRTVILSDDSSSADEKPIPRMHAALKRKRKGALIVSSEEEDETEVAEQQPVLRRVPVVTAQADRRKMTVGKSTGKSKAGEQERRRETLSNDGFELTDTTKPGDQRGACERKGFKSVVQKSRTVIHSDDSSSADEKPIPRMHAALKRKRKGALIVSSDEEEETEVAEEQPVPRKNPVKNRVVRKPKHYDPNFEPTALPVPSDYESSGDEGAIPLAALTSRSDSEDDHAAADDLSSEDDADDETEEDLSVDGSEGDSDQEEATQVVAPEPWMPWDGNQMSREEADLQPDTTPWSVPRFATSSAPSEIFARRIAMVLNFHRGRSADGHNSYFWEQALKRTPGETWIQACWDGAPPKLRSMLEADAPPTAQQLAALGWAQNGGIGVYGIVIACGEGKRHLYVGSASGGYANGDFGLSRRRGQHESNIRRGKSGSFLYNIARKYPAANLTFVTLWRTPIEPTWRDQDALGARAVIKLMETILSHALSAWSRSSQLPRQGVHDWLGFTGNYLGLCTHSPLMEGIDKRVNKASFNEELMAKREKAYNKAWHARRNARRRQDPVLDEAVRGRYVKNTAAYRNRQGFAFDFFGKEWSDLTAEQQARYDFRVKYLRPVKPRPAPRRAVDPRSRLCNTRRRKAQKRGYATYADVPDNHRPFLNAKVAWHLARNDAALSKFGYRFRFLSKRQQASLIIPARKPPMTEAPIPSKQTLKNTRSRRRFYRKKAAKELFELPNWTAGDEEQREAIDEAIEGMWEVAGRA